MRSVVEELVRDEESGAREIALRLLEAARGAGLREAAAAARLVASAHREMSLLDNISWILGEAARRGSHPGILARLRAEIAGEAQAVARRAAELLGGKGVRRVMTLSWSSTVYAALTAMAGDLERVYVMESLPGGEGRVMARRLAGEGLDVVLIPDSSAGHYAGRVDALLAGGDAVLRDGSLVNKAGTSLAAHAVKAAGGGVYALVGLLKVDVRGVHRGVREFEERREGYTWSYVVFDVTPSTLVDLYVTPRGCYAPSEILEAAQRYLEELLG